MPVNRLVASLFVLLPVFGVLGCGGDEGNFQSDGGADASQSSSGNGGSGGSAQNTGGSNQGSGGSTQGTGGSSQSTGGSNQGTGGAGDSGSDARPGTEDAGGRESGSPIDGGTQNGCALDVDCDDDDDCTSDSCDADGGVCSHTLVGPRPEPEFQEICDGLDNDCDGDVDERRPGASSGDGTWYVDCDGDGWAPALAHSVIGDCMDAPPPPPGPEHCSEPTAAWTVREPGDSPDCNDEVALVNPGQQSWAEVPIPGTLDDFDYNCDGESARRWLFRADECGGVDCPAVCHNCSGGWVEDPPSSCGATASFVVCMPNPDNAPCAPLACPGEPLCLPDPDVRDWVQTCR
jgi:hypothetical protein